MALVPQEPKETSAVSGQLGATLLAKPVSSPAKANVGLTAEIEKPSQSQVGVVVIPQSAQAPAVRPTTVQSYGPPSSSSMRLLSYNSLRRKKIKSSPQEIFL